MLNIPNQSTSPYFNLALEEYALKYLDPNQDYIILWQNSPSVIIGRNQNTIEEINSEFIKQNNINVVRRLSGGGAVYHDLGNLNFTFIMQNEEGAGANFHKFTLPVIKALGKLGIQAELSGRNDLTIQGRKFSGNAQYYHQNRVLHHGTLLFASDLDVVQEALNVKIEKIASKGIKSIRSRVTNISEHLTTSMSVLEFKHFLLEFLLEDSTSSTREYILHETDIQKIEQMRQERYQTWEWNYGHSPRFNLKKAQRFGGGYLEILLDVTKGLIKSCKIYGDFLGNKEVAEIEDILAGLKYEENIISSRLASLPIDDYFGSITLDEFIQCLFY